MLCWNCRKNLPDLAYGKMSFRAMCDFCDAALHCCKNCQYYRIGLPNDCEVPGTERINDRSTNNFCEEFKLFKTKPNNEVAQTKNKFNDLFNES